MRSRKQPLPRAYSSSFSNRTAHITVRIDDLLRHRSEQIQEDGCFTVDHCSLDNAEIRQYIYHVQNTYKLKDPFSFIPSGSVTMKQISPPIQQGSLPIQPFSPPIQPASQRCSPAIQPVQPTQPTSVIRLTPPAKRLIRGQPSTKKKLMVMMDTYYKQIGTTPQQVGNNPASQELKRREEFDESLANVTHYSSTQYATPKKVRVEGNSIYNFNRLNPTASPKKPWSSMGEQVKYCPMCEQLILHDSLRQHEAECASVRRLNEMSVQARMLLVQEKINQLKKEICEQVLEKQYMEMQLAKQQWVGSLESQDKYRRVQVCYSRIVKKQEKSFRLNWFLRLKNQLLRPH